MLANISLVFVLAFTPSLRGSHASQARQNAEADRLHLVRFSDRAALEKAIRDGKLVRITPTAAYDLDPDIGSADPGHESLYTYALPWVKQWLDRELGAAHRATGERFRITSLVRTTQYQRWLAHSGNTNAIRGHRGWNRSSHPTGATVDISWLGMRPKAVAWLTKRAKELERAKLVEATKEHHNACFHIMVFPRYAAARPH